MRRPRPSSWAWMGLVGYVVGADAVLIYRQSQGRGSYCTMSTAFEEALRHPMRRWQVSVAWVLVSLHLFDVVLLPQGVRQYEPIGFVGKVVGETLRRRASAGVVPEV